MLKRIHKRKTYPFSKLQNPHGLFDPTFQVVPNGGYVWCEGRSGPWSVPSRFLISNTAVRAGSRRPSSSPHPVDIPPDLYLTFAHLPRTPEAALKFANAYGRLGLIPRHFHAPNTAVTLGECWSDWVEEISQFGTCLEAWFVAQTQDEARMDRFMRSHGWRRLISSDNRIVAAKLILLGHINAKLQPQRIQPEPCFRPSCQTVGTQVKLTPFVTYALNFALSEGPTLATTSIVARLQATALVSRLWLQLAELVTGSRYLRQCEKCQQWMDISDSPRKGSKRMHERCSLALRMARYRRKKANSI
jgi:hypothetical protein